MTGDDEIAVVGMAGRFPGADDVETLWRNLVAGVDSVGCPAGWLDGIDRFDAGFFGVSPREAELMDPQLRMLLEVSWSALEDAGHVPGPELAAGVFAGCGPNRYLLHHLLGSPGSGPADELLAAGSPDHLAPRVSFHLGLTGPSVAVQTACSTSLVAVCLAAQSLQDYRCDFALAGGVSLSATRPGGTASSDGRCRAFDAAAEGAAPASGAGVVVLRRLADALADGDHVDAVLRGWAVTNDGAARAGYAAPGVEGQAAAVVEALSAGDVDPATVGFVEAHGGGTRVGDAIEVEALTRAFRTRSRTVGSCALGSVKTNLGNLDAAGGVAGLIKAVLAVRHGAIPRSLHFERPNPLIDFASSPFFVATETAPWPAAGPRRAGVSAFGLGGTNAHVIVEEAPPRAPVPDAPGPHRLVVSARDEAALLASATRLREHLERHPELPLQDVAYTLAAGRRAFALRAELAAGEVPRGRRVSLPAYPFQGQRYWIEAR